MHSRGRGSGAVPYGYVPPPHSGNPYDASQHPSAHPGYPAPGGYYPQYDNTQPCAPYPAPSPPAYPNHLDNQHAHGNPHDYYAQHTAPQQAPYYAEDARSYAATSSSTPSYDGDQQGFSEGQSRSDEERYRNTVASRRSRARKLAMVETLRNESSDLRRQIDERDAYLSGAYQELQQSEYEANAQRARVAQAEGQVREQEGRTRRARRQLADAEAERDREQEQYNNLWGTGGQ